MAHSLFCYGPPVKNVTLYIFKGLLKEKRERERGICDTDYMWPIKLEIFITWSFQKRFVKSCSTVFLNRLYANFRIFLKIVLFSHYPFALL